MTIAGSLAVGAQTIQPRPFPSRRVDRTPLSVFPAQPVWTLALNNALTAAPAYDAMRAYFPIEDDRLVAYDLTHGTQLWLTSIRTTMPPVAGDGLLFVVGPDALTALNAVDGSAAWQLPFAEKLAVPLVWDTGWLVAATSSGTILALRASDGHLLWRREIGSPAHAVPALAGTRIYVPTSDGRVVALSIETGDIQWERRRGGAPSEILPLDERMYVGSKDHYFYCLTTADGTVDWRWRTGADVIGLPVVDERAVYFVALDNVLRGLDRNSGVQRWKRGLPLRPTAGPIKAADTLIVTGLTTTLRAFNMKDGAPAGEFVADGELAAPPHAFDGPVALGPMLVAISRDVAKGATVTALARTNEPAIVPILALPNPVLLPGMSLETPKP